MSCVADCSRTNAAAMSRISAMPAMIAIEVALGTVAW
jgi:hypothetical protein